MLLIKRWSASSVLSQNLKSLYSFCREKKIMMSSNSKASSDINLKLSPDDERKKQLIEMEMRYEKESGNFYIPDNVSADRWKDLLRMKTPLERKQYYRYLKSIEINEEKRKRKGLRKKLRRQAMIEEKINRNPDHIQYGLGRNHIISRVILPTMTHFYNSNLAHALMFGQKLVIDLGYEDKMDTYETKSSISQIAYCHDFNKKKREPFHLNFCNANMDGELIWRLRRHMPQLRRPYPLIDVTEKSYLDLFPKERLVYLTPHCNEDLTTYNHDDIYIIGGLVTKSRQGPLSLAKAKKESLRMARLPLQKYLKWCHPSTVLTIDQVMKIMFTMKETMNWSEALSHVPKRKLNNNAFIHSKENFSFSKPKR